MPLQVLPVQFLAAFTGASRGAEEPASEDVMRELLHGFLLRFTEDDHSFPGLRRFVARYRHKTDKTSRLELSEMLGLVPAVRAHPKT